MKKMNMNKDYSYAREKLFDAVYALAVGPKDVRSRLVNAFTVCRTLRPEHFPDEFQDKWKWVLKQLSKGGPLLNHKGEIWKTSVQNTMERIKNKTGSEIAKNIFELYVELNKQKYL